MMHVVKGVTKALKAREALRQGKKVYVRGQEVRDILLIPQKKTTVIVIIYADGKKKIVYPSKFAGYSVVIR